MNESSSIKQHLENLERQLLAPSVRRSKQTLMGVLAENFVEFGASGTAYDRTTVIAALTAPDPEDKGEIAVDRMSVTFLSPQIALLTYIATRQTGDNHKRSLRSSLWQQLDGRWMMVFHQGTPMPS